MSETKIVVLPPIWVPPRYRLELDPFAMGSLCSALNQAASGIERFSPILARRYRSLLRQVDEVRPTYAHEAPSEITLPSSEQERMIEEYGM
jgi:hypothetical protein